MMKVKHGNTESRKHGELLLDKPKVFSVSVFLCFRGRI
jgi:hypothetical protein